MEHLDFDTRCPDPGGIAAAWAAVQHFNETLGDQAAQAIKIRRVFKLEGEEDTEQSFEGQFDRFPRAQEIVEQFSPQLKQVGLAIGILANSTEEDFRNRPFDLTLMIKDADRFNQWLKGIEKWRIKPLMGMLNSLLDEFTVRFEHDPNTEYGVQLVEIARQCSRLEIGASAARLQCLAAWEAKGVMHEALRLEKMCLLPDQVDAFGPSKWHTDTCPDDYRARWKAAFSEVEALGKNPFARELQCDVLQVMADGAAKALSDLPESSYRESIRCELLVIASEASQRILMIKK